MELIQGCTYIFNITISDNDGNIVNINDIEKGEFIFGDIVKLYPSGDVVFEENKFKVKLSQEDTLSFKSSIYCQFRLKYKDGQVKSSVPKILKDIIESISKTIL